MANEIHEYNKKLRGRFWAALAKEVGEGEVDSRGLGDHRYIGLVSIRIDNLYSNTYGNRYGIKVKVDGHFGSTIRAVSYTVAPPPSYDEVQEVPDKEIQACLKKVLARVKMVQEANEASRDQERARKARQAAEEMAREGFQKEFKKLGFNVGVRASEDKTLQEVTFRGEDARTLLALLKVMPVVKNGSV